MIHSKLYAMLVIHDAMAALGLATLNVVAVETIL
jgi:hypothetical protein